jgi:YidC/Oxa1 family membrane protein insertase
MFNTYLYQPLLNTLLFLNAHVGNLGIAIILLTILIRAVLLPLTLPAMKAAVKMRDLKPKLDEIKEKYKNNKTKLQQAQLELFKEEKVNPTAGCLPYIFQFIVLIALYRVFIDYLSPQNGDLPGTAFLWFNLTRPDPLFILPLTAAATQLILGLMIMPAASTGAEKVLAAQTKTKSDDKAADDMSSMAATMQKQMLFVMPIMTGVIALQFPSGLALYWVISTILSIVQQAAISGWGLLATLPQKLKVRTS